MPYAPQQSYDFRPLFEGIRSFGNNLNQALDERKADSQKFKSLKAVAEAYAPELKGTLDGMSLGDLEGKVRAFSVSQAMEGAKADRALRSRGVAAQEGQLRLSEAMQREAAAARAEAQLRQEETDGRGREFQGRLAELVQGGPLAGGFREPGNLGLADVVQAAGQTGFSLPPGALMDAMRSMQKEREALPPREFNIGGRKGIFSPRTGAFDVLPLEDLTPAQKATAARDLRKQWVDVSMAMADPLKTAAQPQLQAALAMLEKQFEELGMKPPEGAAPGASPGAAGAGGRRVMKFNGLGQPIQP